jgi:hypothetical protein
LARYGRVDGESKDAGATVRYDTRVIGEVLLIVALAQARAAKKIDIVSVTGCLREQGGTWTLVAATDPVSSVANQAQGKEIPSTPPDGKNTFRLIGVSEFNLPAMRDHTAVIRGLLIKDKVSRINVTSAVDAVASCVPTAPK